MTESIAALLERQATRLGARPFIKLPDGDLTYAQTDTLANSMAQVLRGLGHGPGDVVMGLSRNRIALLATWFGCAKLGAVFMPINALLTGETLRTVAAQSGGRVIVCDPALHGVLASVRHGLPALAHVLAPGPAEAVPPGALPLDPLLAGSVSTAPADLDMADAGAPAKLMYTSGTTGIPKGVVWSRTCEAVWAEHYGDELFETAEGETAYTCLPMFHVTCQGTVLASLRRGGRVVVDETFEPLRFWRRIREENAVIFTFVGTILSVLARRAAQPGDADNPVRRIVGAAAPTDLWRDVEHRFGVEILETWGQTETASCWMFPRRLPSTPGRVGIPSDRWQARLVDTGGTDVAPGHAGELWMRPLRPHVMFEGYLGDRGLESPWGGDGWYHTGDLLVRHDEGDHSFTGRLREAVRRRGEMIPSAVIETAALDHPSVGEAAVVGVPADDGVEEEIKLCVTAADGEHVDVVQLHADLVARLPAFMVPRYIVVLGILPKTPTTRVRKVELREQGVAGAWDARHPHRAIRLSREDVNP